jgi:hypothetical protein
MPFACSVSFVLLPAAVFRKGAPGHNNKIALVAGCTTGLFHGDPKLHASAAEQLLGGKMKKFLQNVPTRWHTLIGTLLQLCEAPERLSQIRQAIVTRFGLVDRTGKVNQEAMANLSRNAVFVLHALCCPIVELAIAAAADLGQLTVKSELRILQARAGMRMAHLPSILLLFAARRKAVSMGIQRLSHGVAPKQLSAAGQRLDAWLSNQLSPEQLMPDVIDRGEDFSHLPAPASTAPSRGWHVSVLSCIRPIALGPSLSFYSVWHLRRFWCARVPAHSAQLTPFGPGHR